MVCVDNVGSAFVSSCSRGNDDVVGGAIRAVGGEDCISGAS